MNESAVCLTCDYVFFREPVCPRCGSRNIVVPYFDGEGNKVDLITKKPIEQLLLDINMEDCTAPKDIDKEGKWKPSLLPLDLLRKFLEPAYKEGLLKYYRESWRKGFLVSDLFDSTIRHLEAFFYGCEDLDNETLSRFKIKKHHLGAALFGILCMCHTILHRPHLDDRRNPKTGEFIKKEHIKYLKEKEDKENGRKKSTDD